MKKNTAYPRFLVLLLIIGLSLLLYPSFADRRNSSRSARAITAYVEAVATLDQDQYDALWNAACTYNQNLPHSSGGQLSEEMNAEYDRLLNPCGTGMMGNIEIPSLKIALPVYHGTEENVLQEAIGHLEWSSLPVGGNSTHCVVSGHRGLPGARLFTDLDKLAEGDVFLLRTLGEVLTYEVDQILIVKPNQTDSLRIEEGKDLCTLVTCTPYGINSHRLLVRGQRIANPKES